MNQRKWGAALSYINIFATVAVGLFYTPVMLRLLGQSEYGLYSLIGSLVGYLSVLDMGLGNTIVRYTAKNRVDGTTRREAELNGLFLLVYSLIGVFCLAIGAILYHYIENLFGATLTADELQRAKIMAVLLILNLSFTFPLSIFASILTAYERFIFLRVSNILRVIMNPILVLPFLYWGYGSVMMVVVATVLNFVCLFANAFYCFRYLHVHFAKGDFSAAFLWEVAGYSFLIFLNAIMDKVYWGTGQFVLGIVSGTMQVAVYAIAMQFMMLYMNLSTAISGVILPKVTMMVAGKTKTEELTALMIRIGRLQYMVVGFILAMFILVGRQFIYLWAGPSYEDAYPIVLLLMGALLIPLIQNVGISILQAMNRNRYRVTAYTICAFISLAISFPLAERYGGLGCAVATATALFISTGFIMNRYYSRVIHLGIGRFWKSMLSLTAGFMLFLMIGFGLEMSWRPAWSWSHFVMLSAIDIFIYSLVMYFFCMNPYEKNLCKQIIGKIRR